MSVDTTFWRQVRTENGGTRLKRETIKGNSRGRDMVFRLVLPGVLVVMTFYKIFVVEPASGEFYTKLASDVMTRMYVGKQTGDFNHQSASSNRPSSSIGSAHQGSKV